MCSGVVQSLHLQHCCITVDARGSCIACSTPAFIPCGGSQLHWCCCLSNASQPLISATQQQMLQSGRNCANACQQHFTKFMCALQQKCVSNNAQSSCVLCSNGVINIPVSQQRLGLSVVVGSISKQLLGNLQAWVCNIKLLCTTPLQGWNQGLVISVNSSTVVGQYIERFDYQSANS